MHRGQVQLILYPGFVFIISIAIAPSQAVALFTAEQYLLIIWRLKKSASKVRPGPTYLYQQSLNHFQTPGNGQEKIVDLLILKSSNTFVAKVCG